MGSGNSRQDLVIPQVRTYSLRKLFGTSGVFLPQQEEGMEEGPGVGDSEESQSLYRILHHLIQTGQVQIQEEGSDSSDEDTPITLKEALRSTESLMMGGRNRRLQPPDLSHLRRNDLLQLLRLHTGQTGLQARLQPPSDGLSSRLRLRELGGPPLRNAAPTARLFPRSDAVHLLQAFLPNRKRLVAKHRTKTFCSQFTDAGNMLVTASQDHMIRFYRRGYKDRWVQYDQLAARDVGWSILDVAMSPDGRHLIYGTWSDYIHEFSLYGGEREVYQAYNLESPDYRFCVFSLRFSSDGSEILAGASDRRLYVYDREYKKLMLKIEAHEDDINAVCFGDLASNIVYSGGDDGLVKVWDRRELREDSQRPVGVFAGHSDGITFIDSRGDGRYLISNSKDQSIKLWDVRCFSSSSAAEATRQAVSRQSWDYRWQSVPRGKRLASRLEGDSSVMSYRGSHTVQHTLIRAYISPPATTAQRYIYSGCARGACVIYDMASGECVRRLEGHNSCVRDLSWHPERPEIVTSSWDGLTARWTYDERRKRCINPEAGEEDEPGDEDSEDEDGNPVARHHLDVIRRASMGRKRGRLSEALELGRRRLLPEEEPAASARRRRSSPSASDSSTPASSAEEAVAPEQALDISTDE